MGVIRPGFLPPHASNLNAIANQRSIGTHNRGFECESGALLLAVPPATAEPRMSTLITPKPIDQIDLGTLPRRVDNPSLPR